MKTISDLNALIPTLVKQLSERDHIIGEESGVSASNRLTYQKDGWFIEITYECCGKWENDLGDYWTPSGSELLEAWGEVTEIIANHYDNETDEESEFFDEDLDELKDELNYVLQNIA